MSQFSVNVYPPPTISVDVAPPSALSIDVVAGPIVSGGGGGGGGATNLDGLTDVVITSPSTGQLLRFDGTNWVNATLDSVSTSGSYSNPAWITSLAWSKLTGVPSTFEPSAHVHSWSEITTGKPTTLSGYGISDAQPLDSDLTAIAALSTTAFGRSVLTQADGPAIRTLIGAGTSSFDGTFAALSSKPTTLSGYGISDAQPLDSDLTEIAALSTTAFGRSVLTQADGLAIRTLIGAGTSSFDGTFAALASKPTTLSGYGISDAQPLDSDLTAIADLSTTAFGRSVLIQADGPAVRSLIGGQKAITSGTASPSGGADGDIYLQYT
jgi:hypothetical protein